MYNIFTISLNVNRDVSILKNIILVLTIFGLWLSTQISPQVQDYLAYGLILTFGVLHGANDITLISSLSNKNPTRKLLGMYLGAMGLVTFFFLISRGFALVFFILISAYHFG